MSEITTLPYSFYSFFTLSLVKNVHQNTQVVCTRPSCWPPRAWWRTHITIGDRAYTPTYCTHSTHPTHRATETRARHKIASCTAPQLLRAQCSLHTFALQRPIQPCTRFVRPARWARCGSDAPSRSRSRSRPTERVRLDARLRATKGSPHAFSFGNGSEARYRPRNHRASKKGTDSATTPHDSATALHPPPATPCYRQNTDLQKGAPAPERPDSTI